MRVLILFLTSLLAINALADTPFYTGGGLGYTKLEQDVDVNGDTNFDDEELGYTLFVGYELNERIAFEGGYIDFNDTDDKTTADEVTCLPLFPNICTTEKIGFKTEFEADGWYVNGQYHFPVGNSGSLDLMGGFIFGDSKTTTTFGPDNANTTKVSDSSRDKGLMFGIAYTYQLTPTFYLRGAGTYYKLDFDNVLEDPYRLSLDLIWDF